MHPTKKVRVRKMPQARQNPVDEYFQEKTAAQQRRIDEDHALVAQWQQAHQGGNFDPELTHQALTRFQPIIQSSLKKFRAPKTGPMIETEARNRSIEALKTFDPTKGATFTTHLTNTLRRLQRANARGQDAYIPEGPASYLGDIQRAHDEFFDELGRPPTPAEHEQRLNEMLPAHRRLPPGKMQEIMALQRNTIPSSTFEATPTTFHQDLEAQNVALARYDMSPQEQQVHDLIYQEGVTSTGAIAKRLGVSAPTASRLKSSVASTIQNQPKPGAQRMPRKQKQVPPMGTPTF